MTDLTENAERRPQNQQVSTEDIYLRNYDPYWEYDLELTVRETDGTEVFRGNYYFQPGEVKSERDVLEPGRYVVTVELDNRRTKTVDCHVGPAPERTIHIELGNGTVSITEGLYG